MATASADRTRALASGLSTATVKATSQNRSESRSDTERCRVSLTEHFIVKVPSFIAAKFHGEGVKVRMTTDDGRLVIALKPRDKNGRRFGETVRSGDSRNLMLNPSQVEGWSEKYPRKFGATAPQSAIWGADGILRLHMPKELAPYNTELKRGPAKKSKKVKKVVQNKNADSLFDTVPVVPVSPEPAPMEPPVVPVQPAPSEPPAPPPPGPLPADEPVVTEPKSNVLAATPNSCGVGHSTTLRLQADETILKGWPADYGILLDWRIIDSNAGERLEFTARPDPDSFCRWGAPREGVRVGQINPRNLPKLNSLRKFRFTPADFIRREGDALIYVTRPLSKLLRPKGYVDNDTRLAPQKKSAATPTPEPVEDRPQSWEDRLRASIRAVNELVAERQPSITLSVTPEGRVKASITMDIE